MAKNDAIDHFFNALGHLLSGADDAREREAEAAAAAARRRRRSQASRTSQGAQSFGSDEPAARGDCCLGKRNQLKVQRKP